MVFRLLTTTTIRRRRTLIFACSTNSVYLYVTHLRIPHSIMSLLCIIYYFLLLHWIIRLLSALRYKWSRRHFQLQQLAFALLLISPCRVAAVSFARNMASDMWPFVPYLNKYHNIYSIIQHVLNLRIEHSFNTLHLSYIIRYITITVPISVSCGSLWTQT